MQLSKMLPFLSRADIVWIVIEAKMFDKIPTPREGEILTSFKLLVRYKNKICSVYFFSLLLLLCLILYCEKSSVYLFNVPIAICDVYIVINQANDV